MRKVFLSFLIAVAASGCATIHTPSGTRRFILPQVGVVVLVVNNCAPLLDIERVNGLMVARLPYGETATVPLSSTPFGPSSRQMPLTVRGYMEEFNPVTGRVESRYLGSATRMFSANTYDGTREATWEINQLRAANRRGGCQ